MVTLEYYTEFTKEEQDILREQNICLDDLDYAFLTYDISFFEEQEQEKYVFNDKSRTLDTASVSILVPKDYNMERILTGCYENTWHRITWKGKEAVIGLAYHG